MTSAPAVFAFAIASFICAMVVTVYVSPTVAASASIFVSGTMIPTDIMVKSMITARNIDKAFVVILVFFIVLFSPFLPPDS